jgi:hypothetical protein
VVKTSRCGDTNSIQIERRAAVWGASYNQGQVKIRQTLTNVKNTSWALTQLRGFSGPWAILICVKKVAINVCEALRGKLGFREPDTLINKSEDFVISFFRI